MGIKSDKWIKKMANDFKMIEPFTDEQTTKGAISYGVSSYGYDIRVTDEFKVFTDVFNTVVDPKDFNEKSFVTIVADECIIIPTLSDDTITPHAEAWQAVIWHLLIGWDRR